MAETTKIFHGQLISPHVLTVAKLYSANPVAGSPEGQERCGGIPFLLLLVTVPPEDARLKQMAEDLKVNDIVLFLGEVPNSDIPKLLSSCEFFLLPSCSEPFGIVLLEAMALVGQYLQPMLVEFLSLW